VKGFRTKYIASILLIIGVVLGSTKDSLVLLHELAHMVPNPFHNHDQGHAHSHHYGRHDVLEHLKTKREKYAQLKSGKSEKKQEKKSEKKELKNKFLSANYLEIKDFSVSTSISYSGIPTKYSSYIFSPPAPPPRS